MNFTNNICTLSGFRLNKKLIFLDSNINLLPFIIAPTYRFTNPGSLRYTVSHLQKRNILHTFIYFIYLLYIENDFLIDAFLAQRANYIA